MRYEEGRAAFHPVSRPKVYGLGAWLSALGFCFLVSVAAAVPGSKKIYVDVFGVPTIAHELLLVLFAGVVTCAALLTRRAVPRDSSSVFSMFTALFGYAALSLIWSPVAEPDTSAMLWTLIAAAAALWGAYFVVRLQGFGVSRFLDHLTLLLAAAAALYTILSFFDIGVRSDEFTAADPVFGLPRVRGPLFGAAIGGFVLLPALSWALQNVVAHRRRLASAVAGVALLIATLGTGSRSAMLGTATLVLVAVLSLKSSRQRLAFGVVVALIGSVATWTIFSRASTDRLASLEDSSRAMTYRTGMTALTDATPFDRVRGLGYASYWRWYLTDVDGEGSGKFEAFVVSRPAGRTLYHPHSTPLLLAVELGAPGLATALLLGYALWRARRRTLRNGIPALLFAGLAGSLVTGTTDLLIFKSPFANLIWWSYVFSALALADSSRGATPSIPSDCREL